MSWYIKVLKNYAVFSGRARRKEYWMFVLFDFIFTVVLYIIDGFIAIYSNIDIGVLSLIYALGTFIPALAVAIRRLHDTNHSGWWYLIGLLPLTGWIILLIFYVRDSDSTYNDYGPNPKEEVVAPAI